MCACIYIYMCVCVFKPSIRMVISWEWFMTALPCTEGCAMDCHGSSNPNPDQLWLCNGYIQRNGPWHMMALKCIWMCKNVYMYI